MSPGELSNDSDDSDNIQLAYDLYMDHKNGSYPLSMHAAAKRYNVARSTLTKRINGSKPRKVRSQDLQKLSPTDENLLVSWMRQLTEWGWQPKVSQLRKLASGLLVSRGAKSTLGKNWHLTMLKRHPELKPLFAKQRITDRGKLQNWYDLFLKLKTENNVADKDIYNYAERGVLIGLSDKMSLIVPKSTIYPHNSTTGDLRWASVLECISMEGQRLGSCITFKGTKHSPKWLNAQIRIDEFDCVRISEDGWMNDEIAKDFLSECFEPATSTNAWRILICDRHDSDVSMEELKSCIEHKIILLCLPPNSADLLQPLDLWVYGQLSSLYKQILRQRSKSKPDSVIDEVDFLEVYHEVRTQALSEDKIKITWKAAGLSPFNPSVVLRRPAAQVKLGPRSKVVFEELAPSYPIRLSSDGECLLIGDESFPFSVVGDMLVRAMGVEGLALVAKRLMGLVEASGLEDEEMEM